MTTGSVIVSSSTGLITFLAAGDMEGLKPVVPETEKVFSPALFIHTSQYTPIILLPPQEDVNGR